MTSEMQSVLVHVSDESGVGEVRRAARRRAQELGLSEVQAEQAAIVATEAGRNLVRHARGGTVLVTPAPGGRALDVLALDRGPGIADLARALTDGYSTGGTAGHGLGAIRRLSAEFDAYSVPGQGTVLFARVGAGASLQAAAVSVAVAGEARCGDGWGIEGTEAGPAVLVVDGLGHGEKAAEAAVAAVEAFRRTPAASLVAALETIHRALRPTRGAAVAIARPEGRPGALRYAGIGNVVGEIAGGGRVRRLVSLAGTAGHEARTLRAFDYEWPEGALLIMHTDGLTARWELAGYPGLAGRHPGLVAGVLYRDFARGRDDATVVVVRRGPG